VAVGYSEAQICRLEQSRRLPDPTTVAALFLPALRLSDEPELASRLLELAAEARTGRRRGRSTGLDHPGPAAAGQTGADRAPGLPRPTGVRRLDLAAAPAAPRHLVDRPAALARLRTRLDAERLVVLSGLAGMGKTTLAGTLARELAGSHLVCWLAPTPGLPLTAETLAHQLGQLIAEPADTAALSDGGLPADRVRHLRATLAGQPTLVCVDNAHLLRDDPELLALLGELAGAGAEGVAGAVAVLLVSREELPLPGTAVVRLAGLDEAEGRALIGRLSPAVPAELADRLLARTGGSPMLLRLALGHLNAHDPDAPLLVDRLEAQPEVASYLVETTLGRLAPGSQRLVALLSVFRRPVDLHDETLLELCAAAGEAYDHLAAIQELQRRQIIDHPARAALPPLLRAHGYATLLADVGRRRRLHRVAAEWSERVADDVLEAAWHYTRAGDADAAADLLAARITALVERGEAFAAGDLVEDLLRAVRTSAEPDPDVVRQLLVARGDLLVHTDRAGEAEEAYREAFVRPAPATVRGQVGWRLANVLLERGGVAEALELCRAAATGLTDADVVLVGQLAAVECRAHLMLSDHDTALLVGRRALELAETIRPVSPRVAAEVAARAHAVLGVVRRLRRETAPALRHLASSVAAARMAGLPQLAARSTFNIGALRFEQGELDDATHIFTDLLPDMRARGDSYGAGRVLHAMGVIRLNQGDPAAALGLLAEAADTKRRLGDLAGAGTSEHSTALALLALGRVADARQLVDRVLTGSTTSGERWARAHFLDTHGMIALVEGDLVRANRAFTDAQALAAEIRADPHLATLLQVHLALARLAGGDRPGAEWLLGALVVDGIGGTLAFETEFLRGALALAGGDAAGALAAAGTMAARAAATGNAYYGAAAGRLAAAAHQPPRPAAYPALLWIQGGPPAQMR
jgi:ATP/maltotriose-dependent transcriptional regulator MalT